MPAPQDPTKRNQIIAALISHYKQTEAAAALGVDKARVCDWLRDPDFAREVKEAGERALDLAISRFKTVVGDAMGTLHQDLADPKPTVRHSAADKLLTHAAKFIDLHAQLSELERLKGVIDALAGNAGAAGAGRVIEVTAERRDEAEHHFPALPPAVQRRPEEVHPGGAGGDDHAGNGWGAGPADGPAAEGDGVGRP